MATYITKSGAFVTQARLAQLTVLVYEWLDLYQHVNIKLVVVFSLKPVRKGIVTQWIFYLRFHCISS